MHQSEPIIVGGQFAGAAFTHDGKLRFVAVNARVQGLDNTVWPNLSELKRVVQHLFITARLPPEREPLQASLPAPKASHMLAVHDRALVAKVSAGRR